MDGTGGVGHVGHGVALPVLVRLLPSVLGLTWLTRGWVGAPFALSLGLALAAALSPGVPVPELDGLGLVALAMLLVREACLGSLVALGMGLPLAAAGWAARFAERDVPGWGARPGPLADALRLSAISVCLALGAHRSIVIALQESLLSAPPGGSGLHAAAFALGVAQLVADALALAVALGLPLLVSFLFVHASFALSARLVGARGLGSWGGSLKGPALTLLASLLIVPAVMEVPSALRVALRGIRELVRSAGT